MRAPAHLFGALSRYLDTPLPSWSRPALKIDECRLVNADHRLRRCGRSRRDKGQTRRKAAVWEFRRAVSSLEPLRRFPEGREKDAVRLAEGLASLLGRRVETRGWRLLRLVRPGVRMLAQDGRRAEGLTPRTLALCRRVGIDLLDQPRDQLAVLLRAEVSPSSTFQP